VYQVQNVFLGFIARRVRVSPQSICRIEEEDLKIYRKDFWATVPVAIRSLVANRPLIGEEDPKAYDALFKELVKSYQPKNVSTWLRVHRLCVLIWEQQRMIRIKPGIIVTAAIFETEQLKLLIFARQALAFAAEWPNKVSRKQALKEIEKAKGDTDLRLIESKAFAQRIEILEILERLQISSEARQEFVCRQLDADQPILKLPKTGNDNRKGKNGNADGGSEEHNAIYREVENEKEKSVAGEEKGEAA
jgi:hypothetical protein